MRCLLPAFEACSSGLLLPSLAAASLPRVMAMALPQALLKLQAHAHELRSDLQARTASQLRTSAEAAEASIPSAASWPAASKAASTGKIPEISLVERAAGLRCSALVNQEFESDPAGTTRVT